MRLKDVTLAARDLDRSVAFYERTIGLMHLASSRATAALGIGHEVFLHLVERPNATARGDAAGIFHVAWLLADRAHLGAALARLEANGVSLAGSADHHVSEAIYLDDPDDHGIELYADRPAATWRRAGQLILENRRLDLASLRVAAENAGITADTSSRDLQLGHLHLEAIDLERSGHFAVQQLGLTLECAWPQAQFLAWGGYHHHLAYNNGHRRRRSLDGTADRIGLLGIGLNGRRHDVLTDPNGIVFTVKGPDVTGVAPQS